MRVSQHRRALVAAAGVICNTFNDGIHSMLPLGRFALERAGSRGHRGKILRSFRFGLALWLCYSAQAGILILRSDKGLQFVEAAQVLINGKDKALSLGNQPVLAGPINKLKDAKLGGSLIKDADSGVTALFSPTEIEYL